MTDTASDNEQGSSEQPAARDSALVALYRQAFAEFGTRALWYLRQFEHPTVQDVLSIARPLRIEGNMDARRLAEKIERLARADR